MHLIVLSFPTRGMGNGRKSRFWKDSTQLFDDYSTVTEMNETCPSKSRIHRRTPRGRLEEKFNYLPNANYILLYPLGLANASRGKILLSRTILSTAFLRHIEARKEGRKTSIAMQ